MIQGIRPLLPIEAPVLATFAEDCFREAFGGAFPPGAMDRLCGCVFEVRIMERLIERGAWVALADGDWSGYVALGDTPCPIDGLPEPTAELARLYVRRDHHGDGTADRLMERFLEEARLRGCRSVWLQAYEGSPRALSFYRRWSFVDFGPYIVTCEGVALPHRALGRDLEGC